MKNKLYLIPLLLALLLLLSACNNGSTGGDATETEAPRDGMVYEYSKANPDLVLSGVYYENGKELYRNDYDYWEDGKLKAINTYEGDKKTEGWSYLYSPEGVLIQMVREFTDNGAPCRDDYRYNDKGKLYELSWYTDDEYVGGYTYTYNDNGDTTLEQELDANSDVIIYTEYSFNDDKTTDGYKKYMYGSCVEYGIYEYNENKQLTAINQYSSSDTLTQTIKNEYDTDGNIVKILTCNPNGTVLSYTECLYDDSGFNYRDIYYVDGKPVYRYDYTEDGARIYTAYN